jgi:hypothetical protein
MRHFIFLTHEGFTLTPENRDIENLQVLGSASGENEDEAFEVFIKEYEYLKHDDYDDVFAMELVNERQHYFSLKRNSILS